MSKSMSIRLEEMKKLVMDLESGASWETCCGYEINDELSPFINLNEDADQFTSLNQELKYA